MSKKPVHHFKAVALKKEGKHRTSVEKKNRNGSRHWWASCTCGWFQGNHLKQDALRQVTEHEEWAKSE
jgi:hypothetical protein